MLTFIIPTYNAEEYLNKCLSSIRLQTVYSDIIVVDGGSTDETVEIAKKYDADILYNGYKLAEYGVKLGMKNVSTELVVVFAADNELPHFGWVEEVEEMFKNFNLDAAWGKIDGYGINEYFGLIQNDPLCYFVNKNLKYYLKNRLMRYDDWNIFRVDPKRPLIWGANGLVLRSKQISDIWCVNGYLGDNDAFQSMIEQGHNKVAYFNDTFILHHHVKCIKHCISKWWRNHSLHYKLHKEERNMNWIITPSFYPKLLLWVLYTISPVCFYHSLILGLKNKAWLYHFPLSIGQLYVYIRGRL